jgi:ribosomal protein RSM22 (predicted rRNA methylase)
VSDRVLPFFDSAAVFSYNPLVTNTLPRPIERMITLPADLQAAIEDALATTTTAKWMREAQALSERYRADRGGSQGPLATGDAQVLGYAALIMPAAYAQLRGALAMTAQRIPHWQPTTLLDLGSGPGTALWAVTEQWPSLRSLTAWEREPAFLDLGRRLAKRSASSALRAAAWQRVDLRAAGDPPQRYDVVIVGHVLNELDDAAQAAVIDLAWRATDGLLLIVEPGTSAAFPPVRAARDRVLASGAHTIAPCVHDQPCPLTDDWCHFPQRLKRPPFQRAARGAPSEWEDSKFCFAAMARFGPEDRIWGRVIRETTSNKAYAEAKISAIDGVARYRGLKRHRDAYRLVRALEWGDALVEPLPDPISPVDRDPLE